MFRLFLINHGYFLSETFASFGGALSFARGRCYQVTICEDDKLLATWCPIAGLRLL